MVLTRKRAAGSTPTNLEVNPSDSVSQSNLSLLASSASGEAVGISADSATLTLVTPTPTSSDGSGLQRSSRIKLEGDSEQVLPSNPASNPVTSPSYAVSWVSSGKPSLPQPVQKSGSQFAQVRASSAVLPQASVVSPVVAISEGEVPFSGSFPASQFSTPQGAAAAQGPVVEQPSVMSYKIFYHTTQPGSIPSRPTTAVNVGVTNILPTRTASSNVMPPLQTAYTILAAPDSGSGAPRHILVPVSRASPGQGLSQTSLLAPSLVVRPSKQAAIVKSSGSLLPSTAPILTITSAAIPTTVTSSAAALKVRPPTAIPSSNTPLLHSSTSAVPSGASATTAVMPNPVSQTLFQLATKAVSATNTSTGSSKVNRPLLLTSSASPIDVIAPASAPDHTPGTSAAEEGEATMSWSRESTLRLIQFYKEHQAYLNDHHYKKKSVWELIASKMRQGENSPNFCWNHVENKWKNMTKKYRDCVDMNRRNGTNFKCRFYDEIAAIYNYNPDEDQQTAAEGLRALKSGSRAGKASSIVNGSFSAITMGNPTVSGGIVLTKTERSSPPPEQDRVCDSGSSAPELEPMLVKKKKYAHLDQPRVSSVQSEVKPILPMPALPQAKPSESGTVNSSDSTDIASLLKQLREDRAKQEKSRMDRLEAMHREKMAIFGKFLETLKQSKQS